MGPPSGMKIYCKDIVPDKLVEGEKIAKDFEGRVRIHGYMVNKSRLLNLRFARLVFAAVA